MKLTVTPRQLSAIRVLKLRLDTLNDPADFTQLLGLLSAIAFETNSADFNPTLARAGVPTELIVDWSRQ